MPHLSPWSKPPATVLALWSFGMGLARACARTAVSPCLAKGRQRPAQTVRQQVRAGDDDARRQRGPTRQALHVATWFATGLGSVGRWGHGTPLARALAATTWGQRCVGLAIRVG